MTSFDQEHDGGVGRDLAAREAESGSSIDDDRSSFVKGRPDWLNEQQYPHLTTHTFPIYTSWASRLVRRDFYRIAHGITRFRSQSEQPLQCWIRELEARIAIVSKAARRVSTADMVPYATLEVATYEPLAKKMLELILEADKATAGRFRPGDIDTREDKSRTANWLSEPLRWVKSLQTGVAASSFRACYPGPYIRSGSRDIPT